VPNDPENEKEKFMSLKEKQKVNLGLNKRGCLWKPEKSKKPNRNQVPSKWLGCIHINARMWLDWNR